MRWLAAPWRWVKAPFRWMKVHSVLVTYLLIFGILLMTATQTADFRQKSNRQSAQLKAENKELVRQTTVNEKQFQAFRASLCDIAVKSWDQRKATIIALTEPSKLAPAIARLGNVDTGPLVEQIKQGNAQKVVRRKRLIALGGARPTC